MQQLSSRAGISPFWISKCLSTFSVPLISVSCMPDIFPCWGRSLPFFNSWGLPEPLLLSFESLVMILRMNTFPPCIFATYQKREGKIVYFVLQTTIRCSGRGRQGTSWLSIGVASSFCRVMESILCNWRLPWNLSHHWISSTVVTFSKTDPLPALL